MPTGIYQRTEPVWNKGLTKDNNSSVAKYSEAKVGKPLSEKHKERIRKSRLGKHLSEETKKKVAESQRGEKHHYFGKHLSEEHRQKLSEAHKDKVLSEENKRKIGQALKGNKNSLGHRFSNEERRMLSKLHKGEKSHLWQGGKTPKDKLIRCNVEYRLWREAVFTRDNRTCQNRKCGSKEEIQTHHIQSFARFPELRLAIDNGITLCKKCHRKADKEQRWESS